MHKYTQITNLLLLSILLFSSAYSLRPERAAHGGAGTAAPADEELHRYLKDNWRSPKEYILSKFQDLK